MVCQHDIMQTGKRVLREAQPDKISGDVSLQSDGTPHEALPTDSMEHQLR